MSYCKQTDLYDSLLTLANGDHNLVSEAIEMNGGNNEKADLEKVVLYIRKAARLKPQNKIEPNYVITGEDVLMRVCPNHDFNIDDQAGVELEWKDPMDSDWRRGLSIPFEDIPYVVEALQRAYADQKKFDKVESFTKQRYGVNLD